MKNIVQGYGGNPYQTLVDMAKAGQNEGVIKGILLHQGESNPGDKDWPNKVKGIYDNLMKDLHLNPEEVPLLAGELVHADQEGRCAGFNKILADCPRYFPIRMSFPRQDAQPKIGCTLTPQGSREFGKRYGEKMLELLGSQIAESP